MRRGVALIGLFVALAIAPSAGAAGGITASATAHGNVITITVSNRDTVSYNDFIIKVRGASTITPLSVTKRKLASVKGCDKPFKDLDYAAVECKFDTPANSQWLLKVLAAGRAAAGLANSARVYAANPQGVMEKISK